MSLPFLSPSHWPSRESLKYHRFFIICRDSEMLSKARSEEKTFAETNEQEIKGASTVSGEERKARFYERNQLVLDEITMRTMYSLGQIQIIFCFLHRGHLWWIYRIKRNSNPDKRFFATLEHSQHSVRWLENGQFSVMQYS